MFEILEKQIFSEACFPRTDPVNKDLCFAVDLDTLPGDNGRFAIRCVMDGMTHADGKEGVEEGFRAVCAGLMGRLMAAARDLEALAQELQQASRGGNTQLAASLKLKLRDRIFGILRSGVQTANTNMRYSDIPRPYCTVALAVVFHRQVYTVNVGDSPIFLFQKFRDRYQMLPLFTGDNEAQYLCSRGEMTEAEAIRSPLSSSLMNFLGRKEYDTLDDQRVHLACADLAPRNILLVGSDGALGQMTGDEIARLVDENMEYGLKDILEALLDAVERTGSVDDFTVTLDRIVTD